MDLGDGGLRIGGGCFANYTSSFFLFCLLFWGFEGCYCLIGRGWVRGGDCEERGREICVRCAGVWIFFRPRGMMTGDREEWKY